MDATGNEKDFTMPIDPRLIATTSLEEYFVDKSTGQPLTGGLIYFWEDNARTVPKLVYELSGAPPNYTFTPLPNPMQLSMVGTPQDTAGNNVAIYYFPFEGDIFVSDGTQQLYFVQVFDQFGVEQFTREAWPNDAVSQGTEITTSLANQIKNGQFSFVSFTAPTLTINIAGAGTFAYAIAPEWTLNVTTNGASTITVTQNAIAGNSGLPFNPPYTLTITPGPNITSLNLTELIPNNPAIFAPAPGGQNGWVASSILLAPNSSVTINYVPSTGTVTQLLTANNMAGIYEQFNSTVQLPPSNNPDTSATGFVNIQIVLSTVNPTTLGNFQIVGLESNQSISFTQTSVNNQGNQLFNFYLPLLQKKPIASYLIGWDFYNNPAQFLGTTVGPLALGANTSFYAWDQTIVFQSVTSGASVTRSASGNGAIRITANAATQVALIQYLPQGDARRILNDRISSMVSALTNQGAGVRATVSLFYTTGATLPSTAANNSLVATLDANGHPATFNLAGGQPWAEVPRGGLGGAQFTIGTSANTEFNDYSLSGWDMAGIAAVNTATFFAIVVGTATITIANYIETNSISLNAGDIPSRPSPTNGGDTFRKCQYFYQKSFNNAIIPAQAVGVNTGESMGVQTALYNNSITGPIISFHTEMISTPAIVLFNPMNANAQIFNESPFGGDYSGTGIVNVSPNGFFTAGIPPNGAPVSSYCGIHWTADSRLGL